MLQKKSSTLLPPEVVGESATASEQTLAPRGAALSAMDRQCRQSKSAAENLNVRWHGKKGGGDPAGKRFSAECSPEVLLKRLPLVLQLKHE